MAKHGSKNFEAVESTKPAKKADQRERVQGAKNLPASIKPPAAQRAKGVAGEHAPQDRKANEPAAARENYRREKKVGPRGISHTKRIVEHRP